MWQKKRVWQVTTIIQLALCHLVTSHFQEIACNYTPKGQIRWPIFLLLLCMIVLTEITSKFPKPIIFRILVFSCHKMTLITIITRMPQGPSSMAIAQLFFFGWIFIQKLTLHNSSSLMTMCPSILAPICASLLSGESVKLRGLKRYQCVCSAHNAAPMLQSKDTLCDTLASRRSSCPC